MMTAGPILLATSKGIGTTDSTRIKLSMAEPRNRTLNLIANRRATQGDIDSNNVATETNSVTASAVDPKHRSLTVAAP
jgi:hypothetical protein